MERRGDEGGDERGDERGEERGEEGGEARGEERGGGGGREPYSRPLRLQRSSAKESLFGVRKALI